MEIVIALLAGFFAGSVPFGLIISRRHGIDIREHGSGNIGSTNVGRVLGKRAGLLCFVLDLLKGCIPTLAYGLWTEIATLWNPPVGESWWWLAVMFAPILGHMYSPWVGFKGGKGVATALGSMLGVFPLLTIAGLGALSLWMLTLYFWRMVGLSSTLAAAALPAFVAIEFLFATNVGWIKLEGRWHAAGPYLILTGLLGLIVVIKHHANIRRILTGKEPKVTWIRPSAPAQGNSSAA